MTYHKDSKEKAQGIVEYALILAFVVGVAVALFNSGGLADAIGKAFYEVSETINNAIDDSPEAKQKRMQNTLEEGLKNAIRDSRIIMGAGDWVEIDAQEKFNDKKGVNAYVNGGANLGSHTLDVGGKGKGYPGFVGLWEAAQIPNYKVDVKQDSGWVGVRIVANGDGQYSVYRYKGDEADVSTVSQKGLYGSTTTMKKYEDGVSTWDGK